MMPMAERVGLGVDHDRAAAGKDERERADEFGRKQPRDRPTRHPRSRAQLAEAEMSGRSSTISS